jgi:hypothetical protein
MNERSNAQRQEPDARVEYTKFVALLVVMLVGLLILAVVSPWLIGRLTPVVLGLDGLTAGQTGPAAEEMPAIEEGPVAPEALTVPGSAAASEGTAPAEMAVGGWQHEVQPGQTLFQIAKLYGLSVQEIAAANNLVNPLELEAGVILIIPRPE